jgi:uncharacterized phage infection (PIP) family protein YhgE
MQKDHLEIILEDMNSKFELLLEGHQVLHQQINELSRKTDERFDLVDFKIGALNQKIDNVEQRLNDKIDNVEQRLNDKIDNVEQRLNDKIDNVEQRLNDKIDNVEQRLSRRIDDVEQNLSGKIDEVAADLKSHRADTEAHHNLTLLK